MGVIKKKRTKKRYNYIKKSSKRKTPKFRLYKNRFVKFVNK